MNATAETLPQTSAPLPPSYMDREGRRWSLRNLRRFFVPHFVQAERIEDGREVVVHRSDFQRTQKG